MLGREGRRPAVERLAENIEHSSECCRADRDVYASAGPLYSQATAQAVGIPQGNRANGISLQQLLNLKDQYLIPVRYRQGLVESRRFSIKHHVDHGPADR
jgi:hypothetical protein